MPPELQLFGPCERMSDRFFHMFKLLFLKLVQPGSLRRTPASLVIIFGRFFEHPQNQQTRIAIQNY